jgi:hypothetical protein
MRGRAADRARRERAIPIIEKHILTYEESLASTLEALNVARKGKDEGNINTHEAFIKLCEKKLEAHRTCLENTKKNLNK